MTQHSLQKLAELYREAMHESKMANLDNLEAWLTPETADRIARAFMAKHSLSESQMMQVFEIANSSHGR